MQNDLNAGAPEDRSPPCAEPLWRSSIYWNTRISRSSKLIGPFHNGRSENFEDVWLRVSLVSLRFRIRRLLNRGPVNLVGHRRLTTATRKAGALGPSIEHFSHKRQLLTSNHRELRAR